MSTVIVGATTVLNFTNCTFKLIKVDNGIIYIFPFGGEQYLPEKLISVSAFLHIFTVTYTFTSVPAVYYYKYMLVSSRR